jgi:hypothetical protein
MIEGRAEKDPKMYNVSVDGGLVFVSGIGK